MQRRYVSLIRWFGVEELKQRRLYRNFVRIVLSMSLKSREMVRTQEDDPWQRHVTLCAKGEAAAKIKVREQSPGDSLKEAGW